MKSLSRVSVEQTDADCDFAFPGLDARKRKTEVLLKSPHHQASVMPAETK